MLLDLADNPMVRLNHAVAVSMVRGPAAGLALLDGLAGDAHLAADHRFHAVRAHLLEMAGESAAARDAYAEAASRAMTLPQQRYLNTRAARL